MTKVATLLFIFSIHYDIISSEKEESIQLTRELLADVNKLIGNCQLIALAKSSLKVWQNR